MYFKRLELFGFKSFADRTKIKFEPGVTAVVGPNGCGKSNISDSIKWVLGEQSAKEMRGAKMEDVIFNGTANKEPINMAEVSLVLSNVDKILPIDYDEVVITRRLFRSGESEYLINKMPVRLKDINDLLAGTGIGQSAYSMIEQGKIGLILSSKPEERRFIFEEASGITKFKAKKKEALKKLEHTETNLIRITDIIGEVQRQIQSIERQAKKAEKYKVDFEELKDAELKFASFQYKNIVNEMKTAELEMNDFKTRLLSREERYSSVNAEIELARKVLNDINEELQNVQREMSDTGTTIDKNSHTAAINKERIEELKTRAESLKAEMEILQNKFSSKKADLADMENKVAIITQAKTGKESELKESEDLAMRLVGEIQTAEKTVKAAKEAILNIMTSQTRMKNELIEIGAELQGRKTRLSRLHVEMDNVSQEKAGFDIKISEIDNKYRTAQAAVTEKRALVASLKEKFSSLEANLKAIRERLTEYKGSLEVLKSKRDMLKELMEKHEGFASAVKAIIGKTQEPGSNVKACPIADVISIEQGFEQAVESFLGDLTNAVLVHSREEAHALVSYLRDGNAGRANFFVLGDADIDGGVALRGALEGASPMANFIKCGEEYQKVVNYIFKDTYVVNDIETADRLFSSHKDARFVTKTGYLREGPRVFDGAAIETDTSVLGRKEKINEINSAIESANLRIEEENKKEIEAGISLEECRKSIESEDAILRDAEISFANTETERQSVINEMRRIDDEVSVLKAEIMDEEGSISSIMKRGEDLNAELNRLEEESSQAQLNITTLEDDMKAKATLKESTTLKAETVKGELSSIKVSYDNLVANLNARKEELAEIEKDIILKADQVKASYARSEELSKEIVKLESENAALSKSLKAVEDKYAEFLGKKMKESEDFARREAFLHEESKGLDLLKNGIRDLEIKINELNYKKSSIFEKMDQNYKVDMGTFNMEIDESTDWEEIKEKISELKEKINRMGAVNLVAIEEHRELEERFSFLTKQKEDLVNAKESLHKAILKINAETKKLFVETFEKVQVEFKSYFRMLFGGGQAEIFLMDERDVLESGIEIVVRPPGKKLQNILLLSGGEKALTAISLLFAIFKVNPSPFCVLDEIDAPLDEINIDRFTRVLQEFLKMSQFIIITHNKKTIQMADAMYGITMEEKGVSKIVSVKFADSKQSKEEGSASEDAKEEEVQV